MSKVLQLAADGSFAELQLADGVKIIPWASSITIDPVATSTAIITLQNTTLINIADGLDRQRLLIELVQDNVGGRSVNWGTSVIFGDDITSIAPSVTPGKSDYIGLIFVNNKWRIIAYSRGY